jgi:hypothetical protein
MRIFGWFLTVDYWRIFNELILYLGVVPRGDEGAGKKRDAFYVRFASI